MTTASLKTTPLNAVHRGLNARMVDFSGWDMPLNYGSQIEEHHAVRRACGMFDVSHMLAVDVRGPDSCDFLAHVLANNVERLEVPGEALYSCMLNPAGGVIDDLIVYYFSDEWYRLVVNAGTADKDCAWLNEQHAACGWTLDIMPRRDLAIIAVQGPEAPARVQAALPDLARFVEPLEYFTAVHAGDLMLGRTGYTGEDGFEIILPAKQAVDVWRRLHANGVAPAGLAARDTLRLEAGMNLYGQDMDETITPLESGLAWTLHLKAERDFIGKSALGRFVATRHAVGLVLVDKGVMRSHQRVMTAEGDGEITSGGFGPTLERSIALARVPLGVKPGAEVKVAIRDKELAARVVKPPFVRRGKVLIA